MLLFIDGLTVDTEKPEKFLPQIKTLLPHSLFDSIEDVFIEVETLRSEMGELAETKENLDCLLEEAKTEITAVQKLLKNVIAEQTDKTLIEALEYIDQKLNCI